MVASLVIGILFLVLGLALRYWINRRKFYRRSPMGAESFSSYEKSIGIKFIERVGKWIAYDRKTKLKISEENFVNGKLEGEIKSFYTNGKLLKIENYKAGKKSGTVIMYAPNGNVVNNSNFLNGRKDGTFVNYDKNGQKLLSGKYKQGKPQGIWKYYKNGKLDKTKDYTKSNNPAKQ